MAFDTSKMEMNLVKWYDGVEYQVLDETASGLLIVVKKEDVKNKKYPLDIKAIPNE